MDVVYLFRKSGFLRVPFNVYYPELFRLLVRGGGIWDNSNKEFSFDHDIDVKLMSQSFPVPCVLAEDDSSSRPQVFRFFELPWKTEPDCEEQAEATSVRKVKKNETGFSADPNVSPFAFPAVPLPPEKLSDYWRDRLEAELRSRKYSPQTRRAYIFYNRLICRSLQKTPEEIRPDDVTRFLALMEKDKEYSASALNLAISAIKFFFRNILKNDEISEQHRPRRDNRLPVILSKEEISKILSLEKNPKHRLLLMLVYSSGLRVSEVVGLKKEHIDISRKVIYIRLGKGRKDRSTLLSEKAASFIEEYYDFFGIEKWIFPGCPATQHLSIRSAQNIFDKAVRRAGITKKISIHGLRHTFATHLLEGGTDIRYIQTLLGHANLRTTERYTHVARRSVLNIRSPLDTIP